MRGHFPHQRKPRAEIFEKAHLFGQAGQDNGLLAGGEELIGHLAVPPRQLLANALPVLPVAPAGLRGRPDQHVRDPTHRRDDDHHFGFPGVLADE